MDDIEKMDFKRLRREVQVLSDELARMKRQYEDILYNLDDDNLGAKIKAEKKNLLKEVYPDGMTQTSSIEHNAGNIKTAVEVSYSNPVTVQTLEFIENEGDRSVLYYLEPENRYYHYNPYAAYSGGKWTGEWTATKTANFGTVFEQTGGGFKLRGNVAIDGGLIVSGDVEGRTIATQRAPEGERYPKGSYIRLSSDENRLEFWYGEHLIAFWSIEDLGTTSISTVSGGTLHIGGNISCSGSWDFSGARVDLQRAHLTMPPQNI